MKRFLKYILIFSSLSFIFMSLFDRAITLGLRKSEDRKYVVWNDIYNNNINSDAVILGSSRAWVGYSPYILDSILKPDFYNLGFDGHSFDFQLIRYNSYLRKYNYPKYIILNVDCVSTFGMISDTSNKYEREQFFPYIISDDILYKDVKDLVDISIIDRYIPLSRYYGYQDEVKSGIKSYFNINCFQDGGLYKGYRGQLYNFQSKVTTEKSLITVSTLILNKLDTFLKQSKDKKIVVVMVKQPFYYKFYDNVVGVAKSDSIFNVLSERYDIKLLDYYNDSISLDSTNFYNYSHLSKKGSELFTTKLANDIKSLKIFD